MTPPYLARLLERAAEWMEDHFAQRREWGPWMNEGAALLADIRAALDAARARGPECECPRQWDAKWGHWVYAHEDGCSNRRPDAAPRCPHEDQDGHCDCHPRR